MSRNQQLLHHFLAHRTVTVQLINKIEKEQYDYKPAPSSMSAKELSLHMLTSFHTFTAAAKAGNPSPFQEQKDESETDLAILAEKYTAETKKLLQSLTDEELDRTVDLTQILGAQVPAYRLVQMAIDHEIHHKGNLFVYMRGMGHKELPFFVKHGK